MRLIPLLICYFIMPRTHSREIKLGFLIPWTSTIVPGYQFAGAITKAIDDINNDTNILNGTLLKFVHQNSACSETTALGAAVDLYNDGVDAYIGPACSKGCISSGMLSTYKKIPMISYSCSAITLSDKKKYPYFVRTKSYARSSKKWTPNTLVQLLIRFQWKTVCLIGRVHEIYDPLVEATVKAFKENGIIIALRETYYTEDTDFEGYKRILERLKGGCRIIVFLTREVDMAQFLVQAYNLGMTKSYAFVGVDFKTSVKWDYTDWGVTRDVLETVVAQGFISITTARPDRQNPEFVAFAEDVRKRIALAPFYDTTSTSNTTSINSVFLYDATMLYAKSVDAMLKMNSSASIKDAEELIRFSKNITFEGYSGTVKLDEYGDRIPLYEIRVITGGNQLVVGIYNPIQNDSIHLLPNVSIYFPGNTTTVPLDVPECGFKNEFCVEENEPFNYIPIFIAVPILLTTAIFAAIYLYNKKKYEMGILCKGLIISLKELSFGGENSSFRSKISAMSSFSQLQRRNSTIGNSEPFKGGQFYPSGNSKVVVYRSEKVFLKTIKQTKVELNREILIHLKQVKDINHSNVNRFIGVVSNGSDLYLLWAFCTKGSLQDVLQNEDIDCDWMFRLSFANDIAKGLSEIHRSPIGAHGQLSSSNCLVDNRWVCKLSNFGTYPFKSGLRNQPELTYQYCRKQFWWAPELLLDPDAARTKEADIYAYGIILYEICSRGDPYENEMEEQNLQPQDITDIIKRSTHPPFRPSLPDDTGAPTDYVSLMERCWHNNPVERPHIKDATRLIVKMNRENDLGGSLVDHMLIMMEKYTNNLEDIVADRTRQLEEEKLKTETLLYKMLPRSVANKLKEGQPVLAEQFDSVTIFFSDIVGFTSICADSSPIEVVEMLNDLYSCFDNCVDLHDVYKVETIGDAYMVVSGLPIRNGDKHAGEIATMSLDLLSCVKDFKIRHKRDTHLQLRAGIHSGSCVAGVVGLKMPRYCLFGDTVNYASRMESSGLALRIHVSPECKAILDTLNGYKLQERGPVQMKGKGTIVTYFLVGKEGFTKELPDVRLAASLEEHTFK